MSAPVLALRDVRLSDGARPLFEGVDLILEAGRRACLVGRNGAGKSTLLRLIAGEIEPDAGERSVRPGARIGLVTQEPRIEGESLAAYASAGGAPAHRAEAALQAFDLDPHRAPEGLSGGEARRAALARALAEEPDILLLDEPTNHLDVFAIERLEARLGALRSAILIVSHDRTFLERVTDRCFWLEARQVRRLDAGFAGFDTWSEAIRAEQAETLRRLEKSIERETEWSQRSVTARRTRNEGRTRALAALRVERARRLSDARGGLDLDVREAGSSGQRVIDVRGLAKRFGNTEILRGFSTRILRGDRVAIVGPNGAGKTTLVGLLLGAIAPDAGEVTLGSGVEVVYLDQLREALKPGLTLERALAPDGSGQVRIGGEARPVMAYARRFLFTDAQLRQPVSSLSGGERNRLLLAMALARPANLLVLDEPTNDLDLETLDALEAALEDYAGTLIVVSHDRDFIDRTATSTIALDGTGRAIETAGGWSDLARQAPDFFDRVRSAPPAKRPAPAPRVREPRAAVKLGFNEQRRLEAAEAAIARLPRTIADLEAALADPGLYARDPTRFADVSSRLEAARADLEAAEADWLELEDKRERLAAARAGGGGDGGDPGS